MKVKMLSRSSADYVRETKDDIHVVPRNYTAEAHPFEAAREYTRAVNAAKLERVFAKPFLGDLKGHGDSVSDLCLHPTSLSTAASASADGQIRLWNLTRRQCRQRLDGHGGRFVRGVAFEARSEGQRLYSVGDDKRICVWDTSKVAEQTEDGRAEEVRQPMDTILTKGLLTGLTHHRTDPLLATCGETTTLWNTEMQSVVEEYQWGVDTVHSVKFNQTETNLLGACASDRSILLYDIRAHRPLRKVVLDMRSNALAFNPMEAFVFLVANEDYNTYAFDLRMLKRPSNVHMDHTSAVTCVDYAPTGKEFVTGSYDKTIRLFRSDEGHSREIYHTRRMQRLTCVAWTRDNKYVLSGSDEMNVRLWKARAAEKMGVLKERERSALEYADKLKEKYGQHPQVKRIARHRQVPKHVKNAQNELRVIRESKKRKEANRRKHSKPGAMPHVAERDKHTVKEVE